MNKDTEEEDHRNCPYQHGVCIKRVMLCDQNTPFIGTKHFRNTRGRKHRQTKHL